MNAHVLRRALHVALDGHALNRRQAVELFNPDPEENSLAERIVALRHHGVPLHIIRRLLADVRQLLDLNDEEDGCHTTLAGQLDDLTTVVRDAELNDPGHQALGVKSIARAVRPALADLGSTDGTTYFKAALAIRDVIRVAPRDQLTSQSLRHELGAGRHDQLLALIPFAKETV